MDIDNLCTQKELDEETLLETLQTRYEHGQVYTQAGLLLLSVNPYATLELHGPEAAALYKRCVTGLRPHVFALLDGCLGAAGAFGSHSVIISGESGAGKTETARLMLGYLGVPLIESVETVLEALGNAATVENENSSRFGKLVKLDGMLSVEAFLLEKSRVTAGPPERNFHIFYYVLAGDARGTARDTVNDYIDTTGTDHKRCAEGLDKVTAACEELGIAFPPIERLLRGIIALGSIQIEDGQIKGCDGAEGSLSPIARAAEYLEVSADIIAEYLLRRRLHVRDEVIVKANSDKEARMLRDSVARLLYEGLFYNVAGRINDFLSGMPVSVHGLNILDVFGFEDIGENGLDQFCINWCNEKLYDEFVTETFENQKDVLLSEKTELDASSDSPDMSVDRPWIKYTTQLTCPTELVDSLRACHMRASCIPAIEGRCGIADLVAEEALVGGSPTSLGAKIKKHLGLPVDTRDVLCLTHFAGPVRYALNDFIFKNRERGNLRELFADNGDGGFSEMISEIVAKSTPSLPVVRAFQRSLNDLLSALRKTRLAYVRCIKPNRGKTPLFFDRETVRPQLRAAGILEAVSLSSALLPHTMSIEEFGARYGTAVACLPSPPLRGSSRIFFNNRSLNILETALCSASAVVRGACSQLIRVLRDDKLREEELRRVQEEEELKRAQEELRKTQEELRRTQEGQRLMEAEDSNDDETIKEQMLKEMIEAEMNKEIADEDDDPIERKVSVENVSEESASEKGISEESTSEESISEKDAPVESASEAGFTEKDVPAEASRFAPPNNGLHKEKIQFELLTKEEEAALDSHQTCRTVLERYKKELEACMAERETLREELERYRSFSVSCGNCRVLSQKYRIQTQQLVAKQAVELELERLRTRLRAYEDSTEDELEGTSVYNVFSCLVQLYLDYCPSFSSRDIPRDEMLSLAHAIRFVLGVFPEAALVENLSAALDEINRRLADFEESMAMVAFILANLIELRTVLGDGVAEIIDSAIAPLFSQLCALAAKSLDSFLPGAILDHQPIKEARVPEPLYRRIFTAPPIDRLIAALEHVYSLSAYYALPDVAIINSLSYLLSYIDYASFNALIARRRFLSTPRIAQISCNLAELERFCLGVAFHHGFYNIAYMREAMRVAGAIVAGSDAQGAAEILENTLLNSSQVSTIYSLVTETHKEINNREIKGKETNKEPHTIRRFIDAPRPVVPPFAALCSSMRFVRPRFLPDKSISSILRMLRCEAPSEM